jgi:Calx-beta domain/FG-GAP-like repeat
MKVYNMLWIVNVLQLNTTMPVNFNGTYTQDFDKLAASGTANQWSNDMTIAGWSLFNQTANATPITTYVADDGSSNTGSFDSYGTTGATDRALGGLASGDTYFGSAASGTVAGWIAFAANNTTGATINTIRVNFDGEQWRNGGNTSAQKMVLQYGIGATFGAVSTWNTPGTTFDWSSPIVGATATALDGNAAANKVTNVGGALTNLNWANNDTLWFRWVDNNDVGNDHGLAIDNFSLTSNTPLIDDPTRSINPTISIAATANASEAGSTNGGFRISRTGATTSELQVYYEISLSSSATFGSDYDSSFYKDSLARLAFYPEDLPNPKLGYVTIPVGSTFVDIPIAPIDDKLAEGDEDVIVRLVDSEGLSIGGLGGQRLPSTYALANNNSAKVKIVDNDVPTSPTILVSAIIPNATEERGSGFSPLPDPAVFRIIRTGDATSAVTVNYTVGGTATSSVDYGKLTGTATIAAGASFTEIKVTPIDDKIVEGNEDVTLTLSAAPTGYALGTATAKVTIADNDFAPPRNDFDGDGKSDILWRNTDGSIATWQQNGSITISGSVGKLSSDWTIAGTGDFNGDRNADLLLSNTDGRVVTWQMNGSTVTAAKQIGNLGAGWSVAGTGDFNGDGSSDVVVKNTDGRVATWQMNSSTVTAAKQLGTLGAGWSISGTGDFNGDGTTDLLLLNTDSRIAEWQISGADVIAAKQIGTLGAGFSIVGTGDFSGDGKADILFRNTNGNVAEWQMNGEVVTNTRTIGSVTADWKIAGTGDFNGDKNADILWRNDLGGVATWQMNGSTVLSAGATAISSVATSWQIATSTL